ncbi:MAG: DUF1211 domain-containing protein [Chloroflexi bacterium]|nr:MAG: DUF1211 domain-containing protein [Chloroflexota bacterium]
MPARMARERRAETSRLEGFSDAVFAFAPSFAALIWIWYLHREFFRRYGLGDGPMVLLNALLLFVVLLYVYPLKFLATLVFWPAVRSGAHRAESGQLAQLIVIYGIGYVAVFVVLILMYLYALRKRHVLHLTRLDLFDARSSTSARASGASRSHCSARRPPSLASSIWCSARYRRCMGPEADGVVAGSSGPNYVGRDRRAVIADSSGPRSCLMMPSISAASIR